MCWGRGINFRTTEPYEAQLLIEEVSMGLPWQSGNVTQEVEPFSGSRILLCGESPIGSEVGVGKYTSGNDGPGSGTLHCGSVSDRK